MHFTRPGYTEAMSALHLTPHLIARAERFQARFHAARMGALADLPGNPFGVEICPFGDGVACKIRHPLLRGKNRIHGFGVADMDALDDLLHFYREDGLPYSLTVVQGGMTEALFTHFGMASFPITDGVGYFGTGASCRSAGGTASRRHSSAAVWPTRSRWAVTWYWAVAAWGRPPTATSSGRACA